MTALRAYVHIDGVGSGLVVIMGDTSVKNISCQNKQILKAIQKGIANADGKLANDYHPEPDTMLQAYAFLENIAGKDYVIIDGNIEEMQNEPGVIY